MALKNRNNSLTGILNLCCYSVKQAFAISLISSSFVSQIFPCISCAVWSYYSLYSSTYSVFARSYFYIAHSFSLSFSTWHCRSVAVDYNHKLLTFIPAMCIWSDFSPFFFLFRPSDKVQEHIWCWSCMITSQWTRSAR